MYYQLLWAFTTICVLRCVEETTAHVFRWDGHFNKNKRNRFYRQSGIFMRQFRVKLQQINWIQRVCVLTNIIIIIQKHLQLLDSFTHKIVARWVRQQMTWLNKETEHSDNYISKLIDIFGRMGWYFQQQKYSLRERYTQNDWHIWKEYILVYI